MHRYIVIVLTGLSGLQAHALVATNWERPIYRSKMEISDKDLSPQGFLGINVIMTQRSSPLKTTVPTGFIVQYQEGLEDLFTQEGTEGWGDSQINEVHLVITGTLKDECGVTHYRASLPQNTHQFRRSLGLNRFFNLYLSDTTADHCFQKPAKKWFATILQGYGQDQSLNRSVDIEGKPEAIMTILGSGRMGSSPEVSAEF